MAIRVTESEKEKMRELNRLGMNYAEIGQEVGRCKTTVACACNPEYGAERKASLRVRNQSSEYKAKEKAKRQTPEYKAYINEYMRTYRQTPKAKAYSKAYKQTPEYKAQQKPYKKDYMEVYCQTQKYKDANKNRQQTPEYKSQRSVYHQTPEYKAMKEAYRQSEKGKATEKTYAKTYRKTVQARLRHSLRGRLWGALNGKYKAGSAIRDLGCTVEQLKEYIEKQFKPGMTWGNWALDGWHIDHINPLASFDLTDREQFLQACHFTNLQPLWAEENLSKGSATVT